MSLLLGSCRKAVAVVIERQGDAQDVRDRVLEYVDARGLGPGDRIGAERELADRFGVGRWVLRKALDSLAADGLLHRTNGRSGGVFVGHPRHPRESDHVPGIPKYLRQQGVESGTAVMSTGMTRGTPAVREALQLDDDTAAVALIERVRFTDNMPFCHERRYFSAELFPGLLDQSLVGSLYGLIEGRYVIDIGEVREVVFAEAADAEAAEVLQVETGHPVLVIIRTARLKDGKPFEYSHETYRADQISIAIHLNEPETVARTSAERLNRVEPGSP